MKLSVQPHPALREKGKESDMERGGKVYHSAFLPLEVEDLCDYMSESHEERDVKSVNRTCVREASVWSCVQKETMVSLSVRRRNEQERDVQNQWICNHFQPCSLHCLCGYRSQCSKLSWHHRGSKLW